MPANVEIAQKRPSISRIAFGAEIQNEIKKGNAASNIKERHQEMEFMQKQLDSVEETEDKSFVSLFQSAPGIKEFQSDFPEEASVIDPNAEFRMTWYTFPLVLSINLIRCGNE